MSIGISIFGLPIFNPINLVSTNAGFEQDFTDWFSYSVSNDYSSNNLGITNNPVRSGLKAFKFGGISPNTYLLRIISIPVAGVYTAGCWYINSNPASNNVYMYGKNSSGNMGNLVMLNTLSTTYLQSIISFSADIGNLEIGFGIENIPNTSPVYIDDVFLYKN